MSQTSSPNATRTIYHGWLPQHREIHDLFVKTHVAGTRNRRGNMNNQYVRKFIDAIKDNAIMKSLSDAMFEQVTIYTSNPEWEEEKDHQVIDLEHLGHILDSIFESGPKFWRLKNSKGDVIGEPIGVPVLLALDLLSNTSAAYTLFQLEEFNKAMKTLLNHWGDYLKTKPSGDVFEDVKDGWFSPEGLAVLQKSLKPYTFDETYEPDPIFAGPRRYESWDSFFTRKFKDIKKLRPVEILQDVPVINNACESTTLRIAGNVKLRDRFWIKGQYYSLEDMFGDLAGGYAKKFEGGTVYQAFLSPQDYHRWNSPVKGKVIACKRLGDTYYAVLPDEGSPGDDGLRKGDPHGALIRSQAWLSVRAVRGAFVIKPDNPEIAMVAFIAIGMAEVSTIAIRNDQHKRFEDASPENPIDVEAGEELGMFHFGGSTHVLVIKLSNPDKKVLVFKDLHGKPIEPNQHHWVNSIIARVEDW